MARKVKGKKRGRRPGSVAVFTPEILRAIPVWLELGARVEDIAKAIGTTPASLHMTCSRANISLRSVGVPLTRALTQSQWDRVQREAVRRGVPAWRLIATVVAAVADNDLFSAVLGDRDDRDAEAGLCA